MVEVLTGDLFESHAQVLVNPVNCVGVMGAGLAKEFKRRFPHNFAEYHEYCDAGALWVGHILAVRELDGWIVNFPTKTHWKDRSTYRGVHAGLLRLAAWCVDAAIESVAMPALGCGLGGLQWEPVKELTMSVFEKQPVHVMVYTPWEQL